MCLFILGSVKDLRESMKLGQELNDDHIICKFGYTDNLERRAYEHNREYGKIHNVNLTLKYYAYIDPINIAEAENDISNYFSDINAKLVYKDYNELVAIDSKKLNDNIKKQYINLKRSYGGCVQELNQKTQELEAKIIFAEQKHQKELLEKDILIKEEQHP